MEGITNPEDYFLPENKYRPIELTLIKEDFEKAERTHTLKRLTSRSPVDFAIFRLLKQNVHLLDLHWGDKDTWALIKYDSHDKYRKIYIFHYKIKESLERDFYCNRNKDTFSIWLPIDATFFED